MEIHIDNTKWYDRLWASMVYFTRLPLGRIHQPPKACYKSVVEYWPLTGWLTGGIMAAIIYFGSAVIPFPIALLLAIIVRVLLTGAQYEKGLAKGSQKRTYGVLALILYFCLLYLTLLSLHPFYAALGVLAGDAYCKLLAGQVIMFLPYARTEGSAHDLPAFRKFSVPAGISLFLQGILPMIPLLYIGVSDGLLRWEGLVFIPCLVMYFLYRLISSRLQGYTGDCCRAMFLLIELSFYLTLAAQLF